MTPAIRAAIEAANQTSDFDRGDIVRAALRAALPAEPPEWFVTLYSRYTSYQGAPRMWADIRAHLLDML